LKFHSFLHLFSVHVSLVHFFTVACVFHFLAVRVHLVLHLLHLHLVLHVLLLHHLLVLDLVFTEVHLILVGVVLLLNVWLLLLTHMVAVHIGSLILLSCSFGSFSFVVFHVFVQVVGLHLSLVTTDVELCSLLLSIDVPTTVVLRSHSLFSTVKLG
jgi:hypothetical protein